MLLTPHVLLGLYFVTHFPPAIGLPMAFISHILFDHYFPHWNPHLYTEMKQNGRLSPKTNFIIFLDFALACLSVGIVMITGHANPLQQASLIMGATLSILPDIVEIPYYFLGSNQLWLVKMIKFEHTSQASVPLLWGITSQVLLCMACIWQLWR